MDIYLTLLETGDVFRFPMLPESVKTSMGNQFATYHILGVGELQVPSGTALHQISWTGMFPGGLRKNGNFVKEYLSPQECYKWLENVKSKPGTSKKMRLLITETVINIDVYLESFSGEYTGGQGDFTYQISFVQGKDLIVTATSSASATAVEESVTDERPSLPTTSTYTVISGDSLWAIAQRFLGNGARYGEIYAANQSTIDSDNGRYGNSKYTIYPGQVFTIPS